MVLNVLRGVCIFRFRLRCRIRSDRNVWNDLRRYDGIWLRSWHGRRGGGREDRNGKLCRNRLDLYLSSWFRCLIRSKHWIKSARHIIKRKTYLDPPSSISLSPSTIWWKSKTSWARSEMNRRFVQSSPKQESIRWNSTKIRCQIRTFWLKSIQLLKERRDMDDHAWADNSGAGWIDESLSDWISVREAGLSTSQRTTYHSEANEKQK